MCQLYKNFRGKILLTVYENKRNITKNYKLICTTSFLETTYTKN